MGNAAGLEATATIAIGAGAGEHLDESTYDQYIGGRAGGEGGATQSSTVIGFDAGRYYAADNAGVENILIGRETGFYLGSDSLGNTAGPATGNTIVGVGAGMRLIGGDKNVIIGYKAGPATSAGVDENNKLYIHNAESDTPLIGGDFSTPQIDLNGTVEIGGPLQRTDGSLFKIESNHAMDIVIDGDAGSPAENLDIKYGSGESGKFRFSYDGQLGVGTTSITSGYKLDVRGKGRFTDDVDMASETDLTVATTPLAQIKDDTGFIMQDMMGIKNAVNQLAEWPLDIGTGVATATIQGYSKIQNINLGGFDAPSLPTSLNVALPAGAAGMEYITTLGVTTLNLTALTLTLIPNGSDVIYSGSSTGNITCTKNIGESIHLVCFEANKWSVVAHT